MNNAREAREVVFELFQDLDRFSLDDYKPLANIDESKSRIMAFVRAAVEYNGGSVRPVDGLRFEMALDSSSAPIVCTLDRALAQQHAKLELIGIDHPLVDQLLNRWRSAEPSFLGATASFGADQPVALSIWLVHSFGAKQDIGSYLIPIAVDRAGKRIPIVEKQCRDCFKAPSGRPQFQPGERAALLHEHIEPTIQRELKHRGIASPDKSCSNELLVCIDIN